MHKALKYRNVKRETKIDTFGFLTYIDYQDFIE